MYVHIHTDNKPRSNFVRYHITSHEFGTPDYGTLFLYQTGDISWVAGGMSLVITRKQAAYLLNDARSTQRHSVMISKHVMLP